MWFTKYFLKQYIKALTFNKEGEGTPCRKQTTCSAAFELRVLSY